MKSFSELTSRLPHIDRGRGLKIDAIGGFDARGFILGPPVALELNIPFFMLRKKVCSGKLSEYVRTLPRKETLRYWVECDTATFSFFPRPFECPQNATPPMTVERQTSQGKMPNAVDGAAYSKEYEGDDDKGQDALCVQRSAASRGQRIILVDDLVATGGTLLAGVDLVKGLVSYPLATASRHSVSRV